MGLSQGASMGICRGISTILEDLQLVRPTVLFSVPALYKKVHDGVHNTMATAGPLRKLMMQKALAIGHVNALSRNGQRGPLGPIEQLQYSVLDRLVLSKIRDKFGGRMRYGCVAGAACPIEVLNFMDSLGIPICEGYGLTETSPIITINVPGSRLPGSVGRAIGGVAVHIVGEDGQSLPPGEEGEICCTGPNIMKGYHNNNEATKEVISIAPDGISRMYAVDLVWALNVLSYDYPHTTFSFLSIGSTPETLVSSMRTDGLESQVASRSSTNLKMESM